jgi:HlyD family secretion protein
MSLTADIETETRRDVLAVPIQSVTVRAPKQEPGSTEEPREGEAQLVDNKPKKKEEDKLDEVIFVVSNGEAKTRVVKRGISDDTYYEVTGKDLEGAEVVSGPFRAINRELENGSKVRVENKRTTQTGATAETQTR